MLAYMHYKQVSGFKLQNIAIKNWDKLKNSHPSV